MAMKQTKPTKMTKTTTATMQASSMVKGQTLKTLTHQQIAERAYTIYLAARGGSQVDHWLQAERELRTELTR